MQNSDQKENKSPILDAPCAEQEATRMKEITGKIHSVETLGALDGPGLRYVLFMQGCPFYCTYCHNPDTHDPHGGYEISASDQFCDILRYRAYLSGGVTISGGEPLAQPDFVAALLHKCRTNHIHGAIDTAGALPLAGTEQAIDAADLLLVDMKAFDRQIGLSLCRVDTDETWALLDYCESIAKPVWLRHVLVPEKTIYTRDSDGRTLSDRGSFLAQNTHLLSGIQRIKEYSCVQKIEFLPFHKGGAYKWNELGLPFELADIDEPNDDVIAWCQSLISS